MINTIRLGIFALSFIYVMGCGSEPQEVTESPSEILLALDSFFQIRENNAATYPVSGTCDPQEGMVRILIGEPNVEQTFECRDDNTFSGVLDVQEVASHPAAITLSQGEQTIVKSTVENHMPRFVTLWNFPSGRSFTLPLKENLNYNFTVDWGDETGESEVTSFDDTDKTHIYAQGGEYKIIIKGLCEGFQNATLSEDGTPTNLERKYLIEVINLGNMGWKDLSKAFYGNSNLINIYGGNTTSVTNMSGMFYEATNANPDTSGWDTSSVTNMNGMFHEATNANPDTSGWDTSSVTNMNGMFRGATNANPDTSEWDTSSITDMSGMFHEATNANPDTSGWDTSSVTDMSEMFHEATNANPDVSRWITSNVTQMQEIFKNTLAANPDVSNWNFSRIESISNVLSGETGLSVAHYSIFLVRLAQTIPPGITNKSIGQQQSISVQYNLIAISPRQTLIDQGWTIEDGGLETESL